MACVCGGGGGDYYLVAMDVAVCMVLVYIHLCHIVQQDIINNLLMIVY